MRSENEDEWMGECSIDVWTVGEAAAGVVGVQVHQSIFVRDEGAVGLRTGGAENRMEEERREEGILGCTLKPSMMRK